MDVNRDSDFLEESRHLQFLSQRCTFWLLYLLSWANRHEQWGVYCCLKVAVLIDYYYVDCSAKECGTSDHPRCILISCVNRVYLLDNKEFVLCVHIFFSWLRLQSLYAVLRVCLCRFRSGINCQYFNCAEILWADIYKTDYDWLNRTMTWATRHRQTHEDDLCVWKIICYCCCSSVTFLKLECFGETVSLGVDALSA